MYTLAMATEKGGTGKTSSCLALGAELHKAGYKVLYVDCDPQGNLTRTLLQEKADNTLYNVLQGKVPATSATYSARTGAIIPSEEALKGKDPITVPEPAQALKRALEGQRRAYDVCILDCPRSLGQLTIAALTAADGVIVPARTDRYSIDGLQDMYRTCAGIRQSTNKRLQLLGVIVTQYNARVNLCKDILAALEAQAKVLHTKVYLPPVRMCAAVTGWQYEPISKCTAQQDYEALAAQIMADMKLK